MDLGSDERQRTTATPAQSMRAATAERVFKATGAISTPQRVTHDGIAGAAYSRLS
jgi:hypothetical protein